MIPAVELSMMCDAFCHNTFMQQDATYVSTTSIGGAISLLLSHDELDCSDVLDTFLMSSQRCTNKTSMLIAKTDKISKIFSKWSTKTIFTNEPLGKQFLKKDPKLSMRGTRAEVSCSTLRALAPTSAVDGPYNKDSTIKTLGSRGVYG
jgi:hypothetical protein